MEVVYVEKNWGHETWFANDEQNNYCGKELVFRRGHRCSMHRHLVKDEVFFITQGLFLIEYSTEEDGSNLQRKIVSVGENFHVPTRMWHRMTAIARDVDTSKLTEVSTFHRDEDVERLETGGAIDLAAVEQELAAV